MTAGHQVAIELAYVVIREGATTVPGQKTLVSPDSVVIRKFSLVPGLRSAHPQLPMLRPGSLDSLNARGIVWPHFGPQHGRLHIGNLGIITY
jgi:hypothetical protein